MEDKADAGDAEAAMAAMGLPTNFAAPAFPKGRVTGAGRGIQPPPPGLSNRGGRGRDGGWGGRGRGTDTFSNPSRPPPQAPSGPSAMRGGPHQKFANARGDENKRKRSGFNFQPVSYQEGPLLDLEDIRECARR